MRPHPRGSSVGDPAASPGRRPERGRGIVYARSTTIRARPESIDDGIAYIRNEVIPMLSQIEGCTGFSLIVDRESGRCVATTSWETQEAMRASNERLTPTRERAAQMLGGEFEVEEWEVALMHRDHRTSESTCARSTWVEADPADADLGLDVLRRMVLPRLEGIDGFCSMSLLLNRETGRSVVTATWDSRAAMEASREPVNELRSSYADEARARVVDVCEFELVEAHLRVPELV